MAKNLKELNEILKNYIGTALILTQWDIREILEKRLKNIMTSINLFYMKELGN